MPKKDRPPLSYDPFTTAAPVTPITYMSNTKFGYDDFVSQRRYARSMVQGKSDRNFDPDKHKPSEKYLDRLLDAPLGINLADAQQIDEEREAALVTQPPEAMAAFQKDIHNQRVIDLIRGGAPIRSEKPSMELQRRRELADTAAQRAKELEEGFVADANPDFFTSYSSYNRSRALPVAAARRDVNDEQLLAAIDDEIRKLAEDEGGDLSDDDDAREFRRTQLERERDEIKALRKREEAIRDAADDDPRYSAAVQSDEVLDEIPLITAAEARQLLDPNPLSTLHQALHANFLQLAEPAAIWQMLNPRLLQHEHDRRHYNIVEFVRGMNLCGAKYDGCIKVRVHARLGHLLDHGFYGSFLQDGELIGGHEHVSAAGHTSFVIFKFYLVRRNKANTAVVAAPIATNAEQANEMTNEPTAAERIDARTRHMHLNKGGLYDADETIEATEDEGIDEYGSLHNIKFLEREFMFSVRIVGVEEQPDEPKAIEQAYASEDDNDYELPPEYKPDLQPTEEPETRTTASVWSINDGTARRSSTNTSSRQRTSSALSSNFSRANDDDDGDMLEDAPSVENRAAFQHSDDEDEENEEAQTRAVQSFSFMPSDKIVLTLPDAEHLVGTIKAAAFMQLVNSHSINRFCIRSFMFYAGIKQ